MPRKTQYFYKLNLIPKMYLLNEIGKKIEMAGTSSPEEIIWIKAVADKEPEICPLKTHVCNMHNGFLYNRIRNNVSNLMNGLKELLDLYRDNVSLRTNPTTAALLDNVNKGKSQKS